MTKAYDYEHIKSLLNQGLLIVYPTDTLYALGADVFSTSAVTRLFSLKHRPQNLPLPVAVSSIEMMEEIADLTPLARKLIDHFLPGSLTLVVQNKSIPLIVTSGKKTVALRIPNDPLALDLITTTGPLTVTSANIHQHKTPSTIDAIQNTFKSKTIAAYIDDGPRTGLASTIVDATGSQPIILRHGAIPEEHITSLVD